MGAVFSRARPALADTLHHALLHGAGSLAHGIPVVGQPVGIQHPHPGQLHQTAHLGVCQLLLQGKLRHCPAHHGLLRSPAPVQSIHSLASRETFWQRRAGRFLFLPFFRLDRFGLFHLLLPLRGGRLLLCVRFLTGLQGTRCNGLLLLGRTQGRGSRFAAVSKQLQVHHLLLAPGTPVSKADIVRVALGQQGKARLGQLKGSLDPCGTGPGSSHRQAGAIGLVKSIAVGVFLARQQADQCLHQGADTGTHDILPCRGIACMARRLQTHGRAVRAVQFRIIHFDHFCLLLM